MKSWIAAFVFLVGAHGLAAAENVIRIGVLTDMSGAYSSFSGPGSVTAATMAVADFGGSVLGRPIEVISADHQNKPVIAAAIANRWIDTEGVTAIVDVPLSGAALAVQEITRNKKRIAIYSTGITSDLTGRQCSPTGFQWTYDSYSMVKSIAEGVVRSGGDKWFVLVVDNAAGYALERDVRRFVPAAGGAVIGSVRHPLGSSDLASFSAASTELGRQRHRLRKCRSGSAQRQQTGKGVRAQGEARSAGAVQYRNSCARIVERTRPELHPHQ
jgi:branched-chain amino acid transport system substrate-binding protein